MQMPNMDGLTLARHVHEDPALTHTKMMILSSMGRGIPPAELAAAGVSLTLIKPVKQTQLHEALISILANRAATRCAPGVPPRHPSWPPANSTSSWPRTIS